MLMNFKGTAPAEQQHWQQPTIDCNAQKPNIKSANGFMNRQHCTVVENQFRIVASPVWYFLKNSMCWRSIIEIVEINRNLSELLDILEKLVYINKHCSVILQKICWLRMSNINNNTLIIRPWYNYTYVRILKHFMVNIGVPNMKRAKWNIF